MPGAGTKPQQSSQPEVPTGSTGTMLASPDAVLEEFGQICVSLPAGGAVIAVRDVTNLRCTVSFGDAPAVGSRLLMNSAFIAQCMEAVEVVLCEDVTTDQRVPAAVAAGSRFRSGVTLPILAQGSVIGIIQVFCVQPSAISPSAIASLQAVARSFAEIMFSDPAHDSPPVVGEPPLAGESSGRATLLPTPDVVREPSAIANPVPEVTQNATQPEINRTAGMVALAEAAKAILARATARTTISHLPSDKPTPTRVWLITAVLLVVLSVLLLFLFKATHRVPSGSLENTTPTTQTVDEAPTFA
jgi:GAF domain